MNRMVLLLACCSRSRVVRRRRTGRPKCLRPAASNIRPQPREQKIEGYVKVAYDVNADGTVSNARVVEAVPPGVFDEAALAAVRTWRFKPAVDHGKVVPAKDRISRVKFRLGESEDYAR